MNLQLAEISTMVSPGKHALLLLDQAGWHLSGDLAVPDNITLLPLPPVPSQRLLEIVSGASGLLTVSPQAARSIVLLAGG
ncbi:MAG: hypothetical protein KatS3mg116_3151 [Elioraea sp.]|nr:MAG: hypothetical protein KatS3mg116_3151 [Elioraea sp.]